MYSLMSWTWGGEWLYNSCQKIHSHISKRCFKFAVLLDRCHWNIWQKRGFKNLGKHTLRIWKINFCNCGPLQTFLTPVNTWVGNRNAAVAEESGVRHWYWPGSGSCCVGGNGRWTATFAAMLASGLRCSVNKKPVELSRKTNRSKLTGVP